MLKKLILFLFIVCPVAGVIRTGFYSETPKPIAFSNDDAKVVVYQSRPSGPLALAMVEVKMVCKMSGKKTPVLLNISHSGKVQWIPMKEGKKPFQPTGVLYEVHGKEAEALIRKVSQLVSSYPFQGEYQAWIGPNQNTFISYLEKHIPEFSFPMPSNASGKDYLGPGMEYTFLPAEFKMQFAYSGYGGIQFSKDQIQFQILGFSVGYNWHTTCLGLPGFGDLEIGPYFDRFIDGLSH